MIIYQGTPRMETNRLILRRIEYIDAQSVFDNWISDERVTNNRVNAAHNSISETVERVAKIVSGYKTKEFCYWGIELRESHELIGEIDLYDFDKSTGNCEVSYSIGYKWWNQGYGTEALTAIVDYSFRCMNIHKISAAHNTDNPASGKIMSKVGMVQEGIIKHMIRNSKNQYKDCAVWGILQEDYLKTKVNFGRWNNMGIERIANALSKSWSVESSTKWSQNNPAAGQCGVTALVVNDMLGGEINKTKLPDGWHFYNVINNKRYDFTASQFREEFLYMDIPSNRNEAYADTNESQYTNLKQKVLDSLYK